MLTRSRNPRWCNAVAWGLSPFALSCSQLLGDVDLKDPAPVRPAAPVIAPIRPDPSVDSGFGPLPSGAPAPGESTGASAPPLDVTGNESAGVGSAPATDTIDATDEVPPGAAMPPACVPGERRCTAATLELCDEAAVWTSVETCASAAHCDSTFDRCQSAPCVPELCRCNAGVVEVCSVDQLGWDVLETCASPALCESDPEGTTAICLEPACAAGETRCTADGTLETCRADLTGFQPSPPCSDAETCESLDANCLPSEGAVEPGSSGSGEDEEQSDDQRGQEQSDDQRDQEQSDDQRDDRDDDDEDRADRDDDDRGEDDDDRSEDDDDRSDRTDRDDDDRGEDGDDRRDENGDDRRDENGDDRREDDGGGRGR